MAELNEKLLEKILKDKKPIEINNTLVKKVLGLADMRDFTEALYYWGYQTDFTYRDSLTNDWQKHLRAFLKSYLD